MKTDLLAHRPHLTIAFLALDCALAICAGVLSVALHFPEGLDLILDLALAVIFALAFLRGIRGRLIAGVALFVLNVVLTALAAVTVFYS